MAESKPLLVRIPEDLHARVKAESKRTSVPMSRIVAEALELHLGSVKLHLRPSNTILGAGQVFGPVDVYIEFDEMEKLGELSDS